MSVAVVAVQRVWRCPLKRRGLRVQGGVLARQRAGRVVGGWGAEGERARGVGWWVNVRVAWLGRWEAIVRRGSGERGSEWIGRRGDWRSED